jgi:hypothetical protein
MLNSDAVTSELLRSSRDGVSLDDASAITRSSGVRSSALDITTLRTLSPTRLTDTQVTAVVSAVLFVVGAWPLTRTEVPPYQDLPNHLATLTVIENLNAYPEYVFNGFFKTNAALFTWLYFVGKVTGIKLAARLFAFVTLAANAVMIPRFVLHFTGSRKRTLMASLFAWPMVHNWFVSMGMLDFAIAVPLSLALLLAIDRHRAAPSLQRAGAVAVLAFATWYAHVFPLLVVHLLVFVEAFICPRWRQRLRALRTMVLPLVPATVLALVSVGQHVRDTVEPMTGFMEHQKVLAPWELVYNLWAEWFWAYSNLSLSSMVPCIALGVVGFQGLRRRETPSPVFFSRWAMLSLVVLYCFIPYKMTNWFHVNSRLIPYIWVGLLLFVPPTLSKRLVFALGVSGVLYTVAMGVDYIRLDRERQEFSAGIDVVPEGARLLPLVFKHKSASDNTRNLLHMWGYYVIERRTSAPLLFAHSRSFPVTYSAPPPPRFNHLVLESFAPEMKTPAAVCRAAGRYEECDTLFEATWKKFYTEATPRYDHLLLWDAPPEAVAMVPTAYERTFQRGRLTIYARRDVLGLGPSPSEGGRPSIASHDAAPQR